MSRIGKLLVMAVLVVLGSGASSYAQTITTVEEDWELNVDVPNSSKSCPQLTISMSPLANCDSIYSTFIINKRATPNGKGGGLQVQIWNGTSLLAVGNASNDSSLGFTGEKIKWTQRTTVTPEGTMTFEIIDGTSQTWDKFGGSGELIASTNVSLTNMADYDVNVSAANSAVDFGNQRVEKLILRKVRVFTSDGKKSVDQALDRVVFSN